MLIFELIIAALFLAGSIGICIQASQIPIALAPTFWVSAGSFPFILGAILTILCLWWLIDMIFRVIKESKQPEAKEEKKSFMEEFIGTRRQQLHLLVIMVASVVFAVVLIPLFGNLTKAYGFVIASFVFLVVTIKIFTDMKFWKILILSAVTSGAVYLIFHVALKVLMPA